MPSERTKIGLEITPLHINAAVFQNGRVTRAFVTNLPEHLVNDDHVVSFEALGDALRLALAEEGIPKMDAALALSTHEVYTRRFTMPAMTVSELELNLPFEFRDYISEETDKYIFDYAMLDTQHDLSGTPTEFDIIAAATLKKTIADYGSMLQRCGLSLKIAAPAVMAYANIIAGSTLDYCFIDIGTRDTTVHMFPQGRYEVTRPVDIGVETFIDAVADHFSIGTSAASSYFFNDYEDAMSIPECMNLYESLSVEIGRIVSFYNFNFPDSTLSKLHVCGAGTIVTPLMQILHDQAPIPLVSAAELLPPSSIPALTLERCIVPIGMAMQSQGGAR